MRVYTKGHVADEIARAFSRLHPWSRVKHLDALCKRFNRTPIQLEAVAKCPELTEHLRKMYARDPSLLLCAAARRAARRAEKCARLAARAVEGATAVRAAREAYRATLRGTSAMEEDDVAETPLRPQRLPAKKAMLATPVGKARTPRAIAPAVDDGAEQAARCAEADAERRAAAEKRRSREALRKARAAEEAKQEAAALSIQVQCRKRKALRARKKRAEQVKRRAKEEARKAAALAAKHAAAEARRIAQAELDKAALAIQRRSRYRTEKKVRAAKKEAAEQAGAASALQRQHRRRATKQRTRERVAKEKAAQSAAALKIQRRARTRKESGGVDRTVRRKRVRAALVTTSVFTRKFRTDLATQCQMRISLGRAKKTAKENLYSEGGVLTACIYKAFLTPLLNSATERCLHEIEHIAPATADEDDVARAAAQRYRDRLDKDIERWLKTATQHRTTVFIATQNRMKRVFQARAACVSQRAQVGVTTAALRDALRENGALIAATRVALAQSVADSRASFHAAVEANAEGEVAAPAHALRRLGEVDMFSPPGVGGLGFGTVRLLRRVLTPTALTEMQRVRAQLAAVRSGLRELEASQLAMERKLGDAVAAAEPAAESLRTELAAAEHALTEARNGNVGQGLAHDGDVVDTLARMYHAHLVNASPAQRAVSKAERKAALAANPYWEIEPAAKDELRETTRVAMHELVTAAAALRADPTAGAVVRALSRAAAAKAMDLTDLFSMIDADDSGSLSAEEWRHGCRVCGCSKNVVSDAQLRALFEAVDTAGAAADGGGDGQISLFEFTHFVRANSAAVGAVQWGSGRGARSARPTSRVRIPQLITAAQLEDIAFSAVDRIVAYAFAAPSATTRSPAAAAAVGAASAAAGSDAGGNTTWSAARTSAALGETMRGVTHSLERIVWTQNSLALAPKRAALRAAVLSGSLAAAAAAPQKARGALQRVVAASAATTKTLVVTGQGFLGLSLGIDPVSLATTVTGVRRAALVALQHPGAVRPGDALTRIGDVSLWSFGEWDTNADGRIDFDELRSGMMRLAPGSREGTVTNASLLALMKKFDVDQNGTLSKDEFRDAFTTHFIARIEAEAADTTKRPLTLTFECRPRTLVHHVEAHGHRIYSWGAMAAAAAAAKAQAQQVATSDRLKRTAVVSPAGGATRTKKPSKWAAAKVDTVERSKTRTRALAKLVEWLRHTPKAAVAPAPEKAVALKSASTAFATAAVPAPSSARSKAVSFKAQRSPTSAKALKAVAPARAGAQKTGTPTSAADRAKCRKLMDAVREHLPASTSVAEIFAIGRGARRTKLDKRAFIARVRATEVPPEAVSDWQLARIFRAACSKVNGVDDSSGSIGAVAIGRFIERNAAQY
jgi:Ca2+-binding EF-hand superfamily protein